MQQCKTIGLEKQHKPMSALAYKADALIEPEVDKCVGDDWLIDMTDTTAAPSGVISITEIDRGTLVVQSSDNEIGRRFSDLAGRELRNGLIIRELSGLLNIPLREQWVSRPELDLYSVNSSSISGPSRRLEAELSPRGIQVNAAHGFTRRRSPTGEECRQYS